MSPVQLQKSVFIVQHGLPKGIPVETYEFVPWDYGPFCKDIYKDAELLADMDLVLITRSTPLDQREFKATSSGILHAEEVTEGILDDESSYAATVVRWVRRQTFRGLLLAIYDEFPKWSSRSVFED